MCELTKPSTTPTHYLLQPSYSKHMLTLVINCELQKKLILWKRPLVIRDCFLHLFANCCHNAMVPKVTESLFCVIHRTKNEGKKNQKCLVAAEISITVSHAVHCPTCAFHIAENPVQVSFQSQPGV